MTSHDPFAPSSGVKPPEGELNTEAADSDPVQAAPEPDESADDTVGVIDATAITVGAENHAETPSVPAGTTKEVLEWVGDDTGRAHAALAAEQANNEPRKGLTRELEERVG